MLPSANPPAAPMRPYVNQIFLLKKHPARTHPVQERVRQIQNPAFDKASPEIKKNVINRQKLQIEAHEAATYGNALSPNKAIRGPIINWKIPKATEFSSMTSLITSGSMTAQPASPAYDT